MGRMDCNKPVIVPKKVSYITEQGQKSVSRIFKPGDFVNVKIDKANSATLFGTPVI